MKKLYFSLLALTAAFTVNSQTVTIPDANFKAALLESSPDVSTAYDINGNYIAIDANADGQIQTTEALNVYGLTLQGLSISDLTGIQSFSNLEVLDCSYNTLGAVDLSGMANLMYLTANDSGITSINLTGCSALINVELDYNLLSTLNLAGLSNLETAVASNNQLTSMNVVGLANLSMLEVVSNNLTTLDLTGCPNIGYLGCAFNQLTTLDLSGCHPEDVYI